jgi:hypothetical protein
MIINENLPAGIDHNGPRIRILFAVTSALSWSFFGGITGMLQDAGFDPVFVSSPGPQLVQSAGEQRISEIPVPVERRCERAKGARGRSSG